IGLIFAGAWLAYRRWRRRHDVRAWPEDVRALALAYHAPERRATRRIAFGLALVGVIAAVPSGHAHLRGRTEIAADPLFAGGPLAGTEIDGLLRPALAAADNYIRTYTTETDKYYDALRENLVSYLRDSPVTLPSGDIARFGFVT